MSEQRIIITGLRGQQQVYQLNQNTSSRKLFEKVAERNDIAVEEVHLVHNGKELQPTETKVRELKIGEKDQLYAYVRAHGGMAFQMVQGECMLLYTEGQVARMSCGHMISPEALKHHLQIEVADNKRFTMRCPDCDCQELWDYDAVRRAAGFSDDEDSVFRQKIRLNFKKTYDIKECPKCDTSCQRKKPQNPCVVCPFCKSTRRRGNFEFCWYCFKEWRSPSYGNDCGNSGCPLRGYLDQLARCAVKEIVGVPNCPKMRCCPRCKTVIEHLSSCKHMNCRICHLDFCFICLNVRNDNGGWQCGSHNSSCSVAPRQTAM